MNNDTPVSPAVQPKRKRRGVTPRAARVIDPGVLAIRKEAAEKVKQYHKAQASGRILKTILEKRLSQLTDNDKAALFDELSKIVTPPLKKGLTA